MSRTATVTRKTRETNIAVTLDLDGSGKADLHTGIGFFGPHAGRLCPPRPV